MRYWQRANGAAVDVDRYPGHVHPYAFAAVVLSCTCIGERDDRRASRRCGENSNLHAEVSCGDRGGTDSWSYIKNIGRVVYSCVNCLLCASYHTKCSARLLSV